MIGCLVWTKRLILHADTLFGLGVGGWSCDLLQHTEQMNSTSAFTYFCPIVCDSKNVIKTNAIFPLCHPRKCAAFLRGRLESVFFLFRIYPGHTLTKRFPSHTMKASGCLHLQLGFFLYFIMLGERFGIGKILLFHTPIFQVKFP